MKNAVALFVLSALSLSAEASPLKMICQSTASKNYVVQLEQDASNDVTIVVQQIRPAAQIEFTRHDVITTVKDGTGVATTSYEAHALARNLGVSPSVTSYNGRITHIFLTLSNNLAQWNEPLSCR